MALKLANNASSTLAAAISATDTTLAVASADAGLFPTLGAGDWFPLTIVDSGGNMEVVQVTARTSAALTIVRAQEGTTAKAFAAGARCDLRLTTAAVNAKQDALGFTPVQQGGGANQGTNKVRVGWSSAGESMLRVQVDASDFGVTWPINISGSASYLGGTSLSQLNASIGGRVSKTGDTMTGDLNITGAPNSWSPAVRFTAQGFRAWYWQAWGSGTANYFRLVDDSAQAERFRVLTDGSLWCSQLGDINTRIETRAAAYADDRKNNSVTDSRCAGFVSVPVKTGSGGGGDINNSAYFLTRAVKTNVEEVTFESRQPQLYIANRGWFAAFPF